MRQGRRNPGLSAEARHDPARLPGFEFLVMATAEGEPEWLTNSTRIIGIGLNMWPHHMGSSQQPGDPGALMCISTMRPWRLREGQALP